MPRRIRLNEKSVREAEPIQGKDYQIFDTEVRGFAICIYRSGSRSPLTTAALGGSGG
jgi:hypothetical protein